jgi:hypothetical protein
MSRVCAKYGRIEEIAQMEATRRERPDIEMAGKKFEPTKNDLEGRRISIGNMKAGLRTEINGIPVERITDKDVSAQVASEKASGKYYRKAIDPKDQDKVDEYYQAQGKIGEYQAECLITQELGLELVDFKKGYHGLDNIAKDKDGHFIIIESKMTQGKDGPSSLNKNSEQMTEKWIRNCLVKMQKNDSESYSTGNAKIALEIEKALDNNEIVGRYVIHTNPDTLNMIVSEADNDGNWQYHSAFRCLENER